MKKSFAPFEELDEIESQQEPQRQHTCTYSYTFREKERERDTERDTERNLDAKPPPHVGSCCFVDETFKTKLLACTFAALGLFLDILSYC